MQKINLLNETVITSNQELTQALSSHQEFAITLKGEIKYSPFERSDIFIFQRKISAETPSSLSASKTASKQDLLGEKYQVLEDDEKLIIKCGSAWQDIIDYNVHNCHYDSTSGDGVDQFTDEKIEDMAWMIIDFDVSYKEIVEFLEEYADVTLVCIEDEEPYHFSSMGYFNDIEATQVLFFDFCQKVINDKIENDPDYDFEILDEDQLEAVEFFKAK